MTADPASFRAFCDSGMTGFIGVWAIVRIMDASPLEARQTQARNWFERLRDDVCASLEALEDALPASAPLADRPAGRFARTPWRRTDHTGARPISGLPE